MIKSFSTLITLLLLGSVLFANEISVTVYNSNLGVVSESRSLSFDKGTGRLAFTDVPSMIDPNSVRFELKESSGKVTILEQNYAYDLVSPTQIYSKYIDHEIELYDQDGKLYTGILLAFSKGEVTLKEKSGKIKIILLSNISEVSFPSLPEGLITKPTLFWLYNSDISGNKNCQVSYQTGGLSWNAEYVGVLNADENFLNLSGWASINNSSGKMYHNASLKLVAGDINRATKARGRGEAIMYAAGPAKNAGFAEKEFFEYHLYTLPRKATIANKEIKQISLFEPADSEVEKVFIYKPDRNPKKVEVNIKFKNSQTTGLGMPLPKGRARIFKADDDGSLILLGEDYIDHTPKDEELNIMVGYAFDISAEERLINQTRVSKQIDEREYEIEIRNHKNEDIVVEIEKKLYGFWEITESTVEFTRKDASTVIFSLPVNKDSNRLVTFRVRFSNR